MKEYITNKYATASITATLAILVLASLAMAVTTVEQTTGAQVTVNEFVSFTVTPCASPPSFGSLDPGATDQPISCQSGDGVTPQVPALELSVDAITNVPVNVSVKGQDFTYSGSTIAITNVEYDDDGDLVNDPDSVTDVCAGTNSKGSLTTSYVTYWSSVGGTGATWTCGTWYWIDVPSVFLAAGTYSGSLDVQASKA